MMDGFNLLFKDVSENLQLLGISGIAGALVKALVAPQKRWKQRLAQGVAGALCALFIGPIVAHFLSGYVDQVVYAWLAAGFLCGYAGEAFISLIQNRVSANKK